MNVFDSHCHLQNAKLAEDREAVIARARDAGVTAVLSLATRSDDARAVVDIANAHAGHYAAVGVHPSDIDDWSPATEALLRELAREPKVVVYGEIGLDYYWKTFEHEHQKRVLREQLAVARDLRLPVSLHCRDAYDDMVGLLREENAAEIGGVAHCFAGTEAHARAFLDMGFVLGIGGSVTYKGNEALRDVLRAVGHEHVIIETDSPYLAPVPHRGKRNEPAFAADTARFLATLFQRDAEELADECHARTRRVFRIPDGL
jgi:TatD DNase family protein